MTMRRLSPFLPLLSMVLLLVGAVTVVHAGERSEDPSEARVRTIAKELRCAVCQNQSVYDSNSDLAKDMLGVIRDKVRAGEESAQIRDYFFQRYGDYIYLEPTRRGMNWLLWAGPFVGLALGAWALWAAFGEWRRRRTASSAPTPAAAAQPSTALHDRIQKELDQVDI